MATPNPATPPRQPSRAQAARITTATTPVAARAATGPSFATVLEDSSVDLGAGMSETAVLLLFAYGGFVLAEAVGMSGIVAVLFCGIAMDVYTRKWVMFVCICWTLLPIDNCLPLVSTGCSLGTAA